MKKKQIWKYLKAVTAAVLLCTCLAAEPAAAAVNNGTAYPITTNEIAGWPQGPEVACETAVLMDADSGIVLYNKGMDELRYPASITKIMTALLAIENCSLDTQVTFSETAVASEQVAGSSTINMQLGEVISVRDCLFGLMIQSANEVAIQLAETVSGSEAAFAELMNQRAEKIGCKNTHFVNASGLPDENHYTTAYDMALIFQEALKNDTFREVIGTQTYYIPATNMNASERRLHTHHPLLAEESAEHYEGCIGGKSGSTEAAGKTLVTGAEQNGVTYLAVVMKGTDMGPNCADTTNLFNYGFQNFEKKQLNGGSVLLPKGVAMNQLEAEEEKQENGNNLVKYSFAGQYLGSEIKEPPKEEKVESKSEVSRENKTPGITDESTDIDQKDGTKAVSLTSILLIIMAALIVVLIVLLGVLVRHDRKKRRKRRRKKK